MTDSITVPIPDEVIGNSPHTVRVTSRVAHQEGAWTAADHLGYYADCHGSLGYTMYTFDTVDRQGQRVTITWFANKSGHMVRAYETSYYTRVPCSRCPMRWSQVYVVIEQDGWKTKPEPLCGDHWSSEETRVNRSQRAGIDLKLHRSDWLRIGQH